MKRIILSKGNNKRITHAVLVTYTQIFLSKRQAILSPFKRALETIGEGCRFLRLIALKDGSGLGRNQKTLANLRKY